MRRIGSVRIAVELVEPPGRNPVLEDGASADLVNLKPIEVCNADVALSGGGDNQTTRTVTAFSLLNDSRPVWLTITGH